MLFQGDMEFISIIFLDGLVPDIWTNLMLPIHELLEIDLRTMIRSSTSTD
jgi:hypothetical protein